MSTDDSLSSEDVPADDPTALQATWKQGRFTIRAPGLHPSHAERVLARRLVGMIYVVERETGQHFPSRIDILPEHPLSDLSLMSIGECLETKPLFFSLSDEAQRFTLRHEAHHLRPSALSEAWQGFEPIDVDVQALVELEKRARRNPGLLAAKAMEVFGDAKAFEQALFAASLHFRQFDEALQSSDTETFFHPKRLYAATERGSAEIDQLKTLDILGLTAKDGDIAKLVTLADACVKADPKAADNLHVPRLIARLPQLREQYLEPMLPIARQTRLILSALRQVDEYRADRFAIEHSPDPDRAVECLRDILTTARTFHSYKRRGGYVQEHPNLEARLANAGLAAKEEIAARQQGQGHLASAAHDRG